MMTPFTKTLLNISIGLLNISVWTVYLAGLGSLQSRCHTDLPALGYAGSVPPSLPCSKVYRYHWFIVSYEFVIMILLGLSVLTNRLERYKRVLGSFYTVGTVLYILGAHELLNLTSVEWFDSGEQVGRLRTAVAGAIMTATVNCFALILLGVRCERPATSESAV